MLFKKLTQKNQASFVEGAAQTSFGIPEVTAKPLTWRDELAVGPILDSPPWSERIPFDAPDATLRLSESLKRVFRGSFGRPIVVVCVGTDRSTGDAFGPIIGTKLVANGSMKGVTVYGNLDEPVHAANLETVLDLIAVHHSRPFILAVDACLGKHDHVGHIIVEQGPLQPGAGVNKALPAFGDYSLKGIVNVGGFMEYFVLQNTRLGMVMQMAEVVSAAFHSSFAQYQLQMRARAYTFGNIFGTVGKP